MSRGFGRVQNGCLAAISEFERKRKLPTTYDITAHVYGAKVEDDGYWISDAQHVAVKRALAGLQRKGLVIALDRLYCRDDHPYDGRSDRAYCWMSEKRAQRWIREQSKARGGMVARFKARMRDIGMKPE